MQDSQRTIQTAVEPLGFENLNQFLRFKSELEKKKKKSFNSNMTPYHHC